MMAEAPLQGAGLGRSAPSAGPLSPHRNSWGMSARPAAGLPPKVCNFQLPEMSFSVAIDTLGNPTFSGRSRHVENGCPSGSRIARAPRGD